MNGTAKKLRRLKHRINNPRNSSKLPACVLRLRNTAKNTIKQPIISRTPLITPKGYYLIIKLIQNRLVKANKHAVFQLATDMVITWSLNGNRHFPPWGKERSQLWRHHGLMLTMYAYLPYFYQQMIIDIHAISPILIRHININRMIDDWFRQPEGFLKSSNMVFMTC